MDEIEITQLKFPENVRKRAGMYIGSTNNPNEIYREIVDNAIDEVLNGYADHIQLGNSNGCYLVADNGRGIPVKVAVDSNIDPVTKKINHKLLDITQAELSINSLHSGSKFVKSTIQSGMNGVGSSVANALCSDYLLVVTLGKDNNRVKQMPKVLQAEYNRTPGKQYHYIYYKCGYFHSRGFCNLDEVNGILGTDFDFKFNPSTIVVMKPDDSIFMDQSCSYPNHLKFINKIVEVNNKKLSIIIDNELYNETLPDYGNDLIVKIQSPFINQMDGKELLNPEVTFIVSFGINADYGYHERLASVNGLFTPRGKHVIMFERAFNEAFRNRYGDFLNHQMDSINYSLICLCNEPTFDSQVKTGLSEIAGIPTNHIEALVNAIDKLFKSNNDEWELYVRKLSQQVKDLKNLTKIQKIKSKIVIAAENNRAESFIPIKLKDCSTHNRKEAELWIVEGDSAGGSIISARDPEYVAVLPLLGRPMTTVYKNIADVLDNNEMKDMITCIGAGVNDYHNLNGLRYGKIIIASDADADGGAISSSVLCTLSYHLSFLFDLGMVYVAEAPLFRQGSNYYYDEQGLDKSKPFTRFKGLGEMSPIDMKQSMLNKDKRRLVQVTNSDNKMAFGLLTHTGTRRLLMYNAGVVSNDYLKELV